MGECDMNKDSQLLITSIALIYPRLDAGCELHMMHGKQNYMYVATLS